MSVEKIHTWEEFKSDIVELREAELSYSPVLFRGQQCADWALDTTLERSGHHEGVMDYYNLILRLKTEIETSTGRQWSDKPSVLDLEELTQGYDTFSLALHDFPHYAYMVYLRHHGFPSPLLDWSRSPFIAAYFAFRADLRPGSRVAIYAYTERSEPFKTNSSEEAQIHRFGPYVAAHQRHFAQQSQYTICVQRRHGNWQFLRHSSVFRNVSQPSTQDILQKFILDIGDRPKVLSELNDYNLNAYSLFASEEGLMETLSIREEIRSYGRSPEVLRSIP
jgi:hypothetical protein